MSELTWTIGSALASALLVLGISLSIGSLGLSWLLRGSSPTEIAPRVGRIVSGAALAVLGATLLRTVLQSAALAEMPSAWMTMVQPVLFDTELGLALRLQAAAALLLLAAESLLARTRQLAVALSVAAVALLAISPGLGGHPAAHDFPKLALAASFVHVAGVGLWLGTLGVLTLVSKRLPDAALATALRRFHRIAAIGVVAVVGTGVAKLVDLQPPLALLSDSTWGLALIAKLGAFALVAVLGLKHWRGADAAVAAGEREALLRSFARELGTALIVLACTAVLINSSPPERASLATGNSTSIFP